MANYVKFKQGLKKDFNTTNQSLTNGMIYFVIDENNNGSIYYDTIVDGKQATKNGTVHRVKFSGLPIKITGSVIGTGVISKDGETIEINTSTNHSHGLAHQNFTVTLSNDDTNLKWTRLGNQNGEGFWLKSIRGDVKAPAWFQPNNGAGVAFGGGSTKGIISVKYNEPSVRFAGGNGDAPVWYFTITGANNKTYDLSKIGGHSSDSAKLDHNVTFKIASTADATKGGNGTTTNLSGAAVNLYLPVSISGFNLLQATRFQGNADSATYATSAGYAKGLFLNPETRQEDMNFNLADAKYIKRVTYSMATSTTKKNKPPVGDANILSFGWDNSGYGSQLAIQIGNAGHLAVRGSGSNNGVSSWGGWSTVLDSSNYTSYINNYYWANVKVSTTSSTETKPTFNTAYTSNWWRSTGKTGWWNDTYSGGIVMEDKTYVKVAGNKSFLIPNGSLKIGGDGNIFFATGSNDATLKIYGQTNTNFGIETIVIQTCFDNQDPQISEHTTSYANRCNLLLQPRGGQVYIGKNLTTPGDAGYKLLVGGNQWIEGNLVFNGAKEIKFIGSKATCSMIRFIDNTSDNYGNGISIGGGGSTVIGAGESAMSYITNGGDERLFLLSDASINVEAGGDAISNRKGLQVTRDGHILPIKAENSNPNAQDLGSAADYWRNLYINDIILQGQYGNRLVWTNGSKIFRAGWHYADTDRIAVNSAVRQGYNFYVNGTSYFNNAVTINGNLHIMPDTDVGLDAAGSLVIGNKSAQNMGIDGNEIMARNNSKASTLFLNNEGGTVQVGKNGITIQAQASSTNLQSGGLRISSENAGNHGNVALELYRGNNGSWQIANEGAILYFRTNWVGEKKTTYAKNTLIIDYTTGAASLPYLAIGQEARNTTYGLYVVSSQSLIKNTLWTGNVYPDVNNTRECGTNNYFWNKMSTNWLNVNRGNSQTDGGITLYGGDINYGITFRTTKDQGTHGYVSGDWATYFTMSNSAGRGWIFKRWGVKNVASISTDGNAYFNGVIRASQVYGAVWNDYAEYRQTQKYIQPGYCVIETGKGDLIKSSKRLQPGANIVSDTFGFAIGETEQTKTPLAVSGRVLAYPYEDRDSYQAGDPVCSGPNGTISKMTREEVREYPDRIIGTVSEIPNYEVWGTGNVKVDNRIWIKVK